MTKWLRGERVALYRRTEIGRDALDEPIYEWIPELVENVLVNPIYSGAVTGDSLANPNRPDGINIRYNLAFPKTYKGDFTHCKIVLVDRGMKYEDALKVSGSPDRLSPSPTEWNVMVAVGRTDG